MDSQGRWGLITLLRVQTGSLGSVDRKGVGVVCVQEGNIGINYNPHNYVPHKTIHAFSVWLLPAVTSNLSFRRCLLKQKLR